LPPASLIVFAGPTRGGHVVAEFFDDAADVPADIFQDYPDGRLFLMEHGTPT
jgi:hypothetical protein